MYWTLELASYLSDAPWPATKDELIDYAIRTGAPLEVVENLQSMEEEGARYTSPSKKFGPIIPPKRTTSGMRMNIRYKKTNHVKKSHLRLFYVILTA